MGGLFSLKKGFYGATNIFGQICRGRGGLFYVRYNDQIMQGERNSFTKIERLFYMGCND